ncbi:hypothetical protein [Kitasatospora sp. NPDC057541]|uniref:hypothetical protein n=1 Tax=unclassified Kitasatospora TaxID=2633591 RepID=UPI0036AAAB98
MVAQMLPAPPVRSWYATVLWWDLTDSAMTVESLLGRLRQGPEPSPEGDGAGRWLWDRAGNRWGRVVLWDPLEGRARPDDCPATELIGYPPTDCWSFELEAGPSPGVPEGLAAGQEAGGRSPGV